MKGPLQLRRASCLCAILVLLLSSCDRDAITPIDEDFIGIYELVSIDGQDMPANVVEHGIDLLVLSGEFRIDSDWTCSSKVVFVSSTTGETTRQVSATYTLSGSTLSMIWEGGGRMEGIVEGDTFTMDNEGMVFVYRK